MQKEKKNNLKYYLAYSVLFLLLSGVIYSVFIRNNKSFVYALYGDWHICFNSLVYYGRWLREIVLTLINEHRFVIPMWDMSVGYGADIIATFNWMTLGDPLNLLAVFFSADQTEYLYGFLAIFRLYLAGLTFSMYGLYQKNEKLPVLGGSFIYAFCGFALFAGVRDVYFMSPMVYLPLFFIGVDKIFKREKPHLFILVTALAGITNFYYFFMLSIWVFIYGVYRYFMLFKKDGLKLFRIGGWIIKCIGYYFVGVSMAAVLLVPIVMQLLGSERFANQDYVPLLYSFDYYWKLLVRFISTESMEAWTHLGFAPICLTGVIVLFLKKDRKYLPYKISFIMCVLFLMIPFIGSLMNAGSYVVNRWVWAFSMLVAYIFVKIWPEFSTLNNKEKLLVILLDICYVILCMLRTEYRTTQLMVMTVLLLIGVLTILSGDYLGQYKKLWKYLLFGCVCLGLMANGILRFSWFGSNYVAGFVESGNAWNLVHDNLPSRELENMPDSMVVRYDSIGELEPMYNTAMNHGLNSTNFYFSLADGTITRYFDDLNVNVEMEHRYKGVDERTMLERLAGVKYCIAGRESLAFVPYGYDKEIVNRDQFVIFENENALPIGYTYDSYMTREEYEKLPAVRKQQALMQCAVLDIDGADTKLTKAEPVYSEEALAFTLEAEEGIQLLDDQIQVADTNAKIKVQIDAHKDSEIYLLLTGIVYENTGNPDAEQSEITYMRDNCTKKQILYSPEHPFYHGRDDYMINLGCSDQAEELVAYIQFSKPGIYNLGELQVVGQSMEQVDEQTNALAEESLQNIVTDTNKICGRLTVSDDKILCIAVPYSKGWKAYVDGVQTEVKCVNGVYNGLLVAPGEHEIILKYRTPGLSAGLFLFAAGICSFAGIVIYWRRKS